VDRPAADVRTRARALAALATVFAILLMHGLSCVAGADHVAGTPVAAAAPQVVLAAPGNPSHCPGCHSRGHVPAKPTRADSAGIPMLAGGGDGTGGTEDRHGHDAGLCVTVLAGLALLALLAAAASATERPARAAPGRCLRLRLASPSAVLRPSLSALCVLRI
jgi:hypothetical protein